MPNPSNRSFFLGPVAPSDVLSYAHKIQNKISSGHDDISSKLMKITINIIIEPLTHIINQSLKTGIVPSEMKIAKVIPIHKSSDKSVLENYRPVSLLPAFSKLLEKNVFNALITFLSKNSIFYKHQYGFRPKHSTIHPIIHLLNHCASKSSNIDPEMSLAVLCDLSKAFDVVDHGIILNKLSNYGIRGIANDWFRSYLTGRYQFVSIEGVRSQMAHIKIGVPQGSILGPLLYLVYVNDIGNSCSGSILSFADDATLITSHANLLDLYTIANRNINELFMWFCANKLSLNAGKTKYIVLRPRHMKQNLSLHTVHIGDTVISRIGNDCIEKTTKNFGMHLDENLSWKYHINEVNKKVSRALFSIKQVKKILPLHCLRTLYNALIQPHLSYGIIAWGNSDKNLIHKTNQLQKRALRVIHNAPYNSQTDPKFRKLNILKLNDLFEYQSLICMHDYLSGKLPISFDGEFPHNRDIMNYKCTRQSELLYVPKYSTKYSQKSPAYHLPKLWNKWARLFPENVIKNVMTKFIKTKFIQKYQEHVKCQNMRCPDCHTSS